MRNSHIIVGIIALCSFFWSCEADLEEGPYTSDIDTYSEHYWTYDTVFFYNYAPSSFSCKWYFGDGDSSLSFEPFHIYESPGIYQVTLELYDSAAESQEYPERTIHDNIVIEQPTDLLLKVVYDHNGLPVNHCLVNLYRSHADWNNFFNVYDQKYTSEDGLVFFRDIDPVKYWVDAIKKEIDNVDTTFYSNYRSFVTTDTLTEDSLNYYQVVINAETKKRYNK